MTWINTGAPTMCGINGIFGYSNDAAPVSRERLLATRDTMAARGPDGAGLWMATEANVGLGHQRLAIIDLSPAAAQPMRSEDGALVVTFNGEIYNHGALRAQLESRGAVFRTRSDTEVLLHLYRERGSDMVDCLRGMFAFAIWDGRRGGLLLARDHFGIKPLYYADDGKTLSFASQAKALLAGGGIDASTSPAGLVGYYLWGSLPEPYTLHRGIRTLPSGTTLWVERGGRPSVRRYWSISHELQDAGRATVESPAAMREELAAALRDSVRHHLVADVPVGVFLSAGLDSSTIAALAQENSSRPVRGLTLGFREFAGTERDEVPQSRQIAAHYGLTHSTDIVTKADMEAEIDGIHAAMDQPSIDGVNTYFVSRSAARLGMRTVLSGTGGDELFGGYPSFREIPAAAAVLAHVPMSRSIGKAFRVVTAPWLGHFTSPKYAGLLEYGATYGGLYLLRRGLFMPWELPTLMDPEMAREGWRTLRPVLRLDRKVARIHSPHAKVAAMEMRMYLRNQLLRDADWAGMAWSVEIRTPLVDVELFRTVAPWLGLPNAPTKRDMACAPLRPLPEATLARRKTGFGIPVAEWLGLEGASGMRGWARMLVSRVDHLKGH